MADIQRDSKKFQGLLNRDTVSSLSAEFEESMKKDIEKSVILGTIDVIEKIACHKLNEPPKLDDFGNRNPDHVATNGHNCGRGIVDFQDLYSLFRRPEAMAEDDGFGFYGAALEGVLSKAPRDVEES